MFTIFGWGKGSKLFPITGSTESAVLTTFGYFHIWWLLRLTFNRKWLKVTVLDNGEGYTRLEEKNLTYSEAVEVAGYKIIKPWWVVANQSLAAALAVLIIMVSVVGAIATIYPPKVEAMNVTKILNSSTWSPAEEEFVAINATDEESKAFASKFKKADKLIKYLNLRTSKKPKMTTPAVTPTPKVEVKKEL
jgi:hypothetical protein